jgi:dihydrofolate synthase / folylpolyglutamate synthase
MHRLAILIIRSIHDTIQAFAAARMDVCITWRNETHRVVRSGMDYREAIAYVIERSGYDRGFVANPFDAETIGLKRTARLLELSGYPERRYPSIHVAGSKGKGSTAAFLASVLHADGRRVGLYTTPHLHTFRERIQIGGSPISETDFADLTAQLAGLNSTLARERPDWGEATAFEVTTALAFCAFAHAVVDVAVIEVGLGGRLDATNVIEPRVSVISSISFDHVGILGNTLREIATEKGGIIKPGRPVVSAAQHPEAAAALDAIASERGSGLYLGGRDWRVRGTSERFDVEGPLATVAGLTSGLAGRHQTENAGLAVSTLQVLQFHGLPVTEDAIRSGIAGVTWPGRFEIVQASPLIIVDGAHNVDSARRVAETLLDRYPDVRRTLVLGIARDKDIAGMLRELLPVAERVIATASHSPRAATPDEIVATAREIDAAVALETSASVAEALARVESTPHAQDVTLVTGSLYAVAEAREALGLASAPAFERELLYR